MTSHHVYLPISDVLLGQVAVAVLERGQTLASMRSVVGGDQWQKLEQAMLAAGLARATQGEDQHALALTPAGRALLKYYLPGFVKKNEKITGEDRPREKKFWSAFGEYKVRGVSVELVRQRLVTALGDLGAQVQVSADGTVLFRDDNIFTLFLVKGFYFHRLSSISPGRIEFVQTFTGELSVKYHLSTWRLAMFAFLPLIVFIILSPPLFVGDGYLLNLLLTILLAFTVGAAIYGFCRLATNQSFYSLVEKVCLEAVRQSCRVPGAVRRAG